MYDPYHRLVGRSQAIQDLKKSIEKVAATDMPVLLTGETGVGKEVVARVIHDVSPRSRKPFIPLNMASLPENLIESDLFGYKKGAFTGALRDHKGRFLEADGGTLFMDEIGEMALNLQSKLLRVLEDHTVVPLGGDMKDARQVDVRIIAATNRSLPTMVKKRTFRQDLYYRLNVLPIHIPPLRERREDIPLLIDHFIKELTRKHTYKMFRLSEKALISLQHSPWQGNVRELFQCIQRLAVWYPGQEIQYEDLPIEYRIELIEDYRLIIPEGYVPVCLYGEEAVSSSSSVNSATSHVGAKSAETSATSSDRRVVAEGEAEATTREEPDPLAGVDVRQGVDLSAYLKEIEFNLIVEALKVARGNNSQAARLLKMNRTTLVEKIKRYGIRSEEFVE